jgi:hypothetical protein
MPQASEAQKRASRAWYAKNKEANAVARKEKYAGESETRQRFRNNAKRSYYKRKLAELDNTDESDEGAAVSTLVEVKIVVPTSTDLEEKMKLNYINYII